MVQDFRKSEFLFVVLFSVLSFSFFFFWQKHLRAWVEYLTYNLIDINFFVFCSFLMRNFLDMKSVFGVCETETARQWRLLGFYCHSFSFYMKQWFEDFLLFFSDAYSFRTVNVEIYSVHLFVHLSATCLWNTGFSLYSGIYWNVNVPDQQALFLVFMNLRLETQELLSP